MRAYFGHTVPLFPPRRINQLVGFSVVDASKRHHLRLRFKQTW